MYTEYVTFMQWLKTQRNEDTPIGDLARDVALDMAWPSRGSFGAQLAYLINFPSMEEAKDTLHDAWHKYLDHVWQEYKYPGSN